MRWNFPKTLQATENFSESRLQAKLRKWIDCLPIMQFILSIVFLFSSSFLHPFPFLSPSWWTAPISSTPSSTDKPGTENDSTDGSRPNQDVYQTGDTSSKAICNKGLYSFIYADWMNSLHIGNFFGLSQQYTNQDICFAELGFPSNYHVNIEPYGFRTHYQSNLAKNSKVDFSIFTFGLIGSAGYTLWDVLDIGAGIGYSYSHSKADCQGEFNLQSLYFGPYLQYIFRSGYLGFMLYGMSNFYGENKSTEVKQSGFNLGSRLEAGYDFQAPLTFANNIYVHPYARIDYLSAFEKKFKKEQNETSTEYASFLRSKLAFKLSKKIEINKMYCFMSTIDLGWVRMLALADTQLKMKSQEESKKPEKIKTVTKDQLDLGLEVNWIRDEFFLVGLNLEALFFDKAPTQLAKVRMEWNW